MHTLVFNLTRFGDLLQTQPVISGLRRRGDTVGLICLDNFASATHLLRDLAYVRPLPGGKLLATLERDWKEGLATLWQWCGSALQSVSDAGTAGASPPAADRYLNLTTALSVRLLAAMLAHRQRRLGGPQPESLGFGLDACGFVVNSNPWGTFLQSSSKNRGCSPFNLVDLFWKTAGLGPGERRYHLRTPETAALAKADVLLAEAGAGRRFVAFQLGASENRRRWPVASFAALGKRLLEEKGCYPVLLGSLEEAGLANRYKELGGPGMSLVGRTSLDVLAAVLTRMQLLVSNDTGTMHLAAGLGLPILAVFLATAQPWDTGPYKEGNICLEPDLPCHPCQFGKTCPREELCRRSIEPSAVFSLCTALLEQTPEQWGDLSGLGCRVWRTRVEEDNFMGLVSLSGHDATDRVRWIRLQRHFYRHFLDNTIPPVFTGHVGSLSARAHAEITTTLRNAAALLALLEEQGKVLERAPREVLKKKFLETWQRVQSLWESNTYFNVLSYLWRNETQDSGQNLSSILAVISRYRQLSQIWLSLLQ